MAASVARSKGKTENKHPPSLVEEESPRPSTTTPSKAGDLSFVLNVTQSPPRNNPRSTPSKSPNVHPVKQSQTSPPPQEPLSSVPEPPPTFTPAEPAHNRTPL